jgi:uncharacterized membrane protein
MSWFILAVASAFFQALTDTFSKSFTRQFNVYQLSALLFGISALMLIPVFLATEMPVIQDGFYSILLIVCLLDLMGVLLYMQALKSSDISLVMPLQMFTPLFLLVTAPLMLGEFPAPLGVAGVIMIVIGSYVLNLRTRESSFLDPFRALITDPGARCMLAGAFIWSLTCNLHKSALLLSSPLFYLLAHHLVVTAFLIPLVIWKSRSKGVVAADIDDPPRFTATRILGLGIVGTLTGLCQLSALEVGLVVYVTSIKRTSVLAAICLGALIYKELGFRERFAGASLMVVGAVMTAL